jgi:hypothetical protein
MATAFGAPLRGATEFPTLEGLAAHRGAAVHWNLCGPQDRPPRAPVLYSPRDPTVRGVCSGVTAAVMHHGPADALRPRGLRTAAWCTTALLQSCAWAGCEASKAQAPAVGDPATHDGCNRSWRMKGCGVAQRREFGSTAQRCAERRSHRGAARPRAALPPQNVHAQLCRPERRLPSAQRCRSERPRAALPRTNEEVCY